MLEGSAAATAFSGPPAVPQDGQELYEGTHEAAPFLYKQKESPQGRQPNPALSAMLVRSSPGSKQRDGLFLLHQVVPAGGTPGSPGATLQYVGALGMRIKMQLPGPQRRTRVRSSGDGALNAVL